VSITSTASIASIDRVRQYSVNRFDRSLRIHRSRRGGPSHRVRDFAPRLADSHTVTHPPARLVGVILLVDAPRPQVRDLPPRWSSTPTAESPARAAPVAPAVIAAAAQADEGVGMRRRLGSRWLGASRP
jgi:hypothetical protein